MKQAAGGHPWRLAAHPQGRERETLVLAVAHRVLPCRSPPALWATWPLAIGASLLSAGLWLLPPSSLTIVCVTGEGTGLFTSGCLSLRPWRMGMITPAVRAGCLAECTQLVLSTCL